MNERRAQLVVVGCALATAIAAGGWYRSHALWRAEREAMVSGTLGRVAELLEEHDRIVLELRGDASREQDVGILRSYLARVRRDGVARHADMKQRLDRLAENHAAIVALLQAYAPRARTRAFAFESDAFRNYAAAWRDRWNSVMELYMAGGDYAAAEQAFPDDFAAAVAAEIAAAR
jgi:hypothetical protein